MGVECVSCKGARTLLCKLGGGPEGLYLLGHNLVTELERGSGGVLPHSEEPEALGNVGTCSRTTR